MDALIKNVDEEVWKKFKIEAIKHGKKLGEFFNDIVVENQCTGGNWETIKKSKATLTAKEAIEMKKVMKDFRKNFRMRIL